MVTLAAVEGGGTTFVCAIAKDTASNIVDRVSFPTTTPEETLGKCRAWLLARSFDALGIAELRDDRPNLKAWWATVSTMPNWEYATSGKVATEKVAKAA